jgi:hypothetical protein
MVSRAAAADPEAKQLRPATSAPKPEAERLRAELGRSNGHCGKAFERDKVIGAISSRNISGGTQHMQSVF